ncbi:hypothetical protein [Inquilinus sp. OTU3971]|uniref:hypothetical protein n=1 Tax=Inquilinus sp. OTU3971 TaxID=3043855 RepID=UPI00313BFFCB
MSDPNASAMPAPLPLSRLIETVYGRLFGDLGVFMRIALVWTGIAVLLLVALGILAPQAWDGPGESFITAVVGAGTAIGWHRFVLREERRAFSGPNTLARYVLLAFVAVLPGAAILLIGTPTVAVLLRGLGDRAGATVITTVIILLVAVGAAVTFRFSLILPAVAIGDRSMTFRRSWAATRGNVARIFVGGIVVQIPPWLGIGLLAWLLERWRGAPRASGPGIGDYVFAIIAALLLLLLSALATALFAGFLSELYLRLRQDPQDPAPTL